MGFRDLLERQADVGSDVSLSSRLRDRRFARFAAMIEARPKPVTILDVGGTVKYWHSRGYADRDDVQVTAANYHPGTKRYRNIRSVQADAADLSMFEDRSFDLVFSNSTIEHLAEKRNQRAMADEVRRLASAYYVQTPNYWFPIEPHFLAPGWQYLPRSVRIAIIRRIRVGHRGPWHDPAEAVREIDEIRLLRRSEMSEMFPDAQIISERIGPLTKSFVAVRDPLAQRS